MISVEKTRRKICNDYKKSLELVVKVDNVMKSGYNGGVTRKEHYDRLVWQEGLKPSFKSFCKALEVLGYAYRVTERVYREKPNHENITFRAFARIVHEINVNMDSIAFFDQSTFTFEHNPRRSWQSRTNRTAFISTTNYKRVHLLMMVNLQGFYCWQLYTGKSIAQVLCRFILRSIELMSTRNDGRGIKIVLDNATMHKTHLFQKLSFMTKTKFIFTAPHTPFLNVIERCFRFLKAPIRNNHEPNE